MVEKVKMQILSTQRLFTDMNFDVLRYTDWYP